MKRKKNIAFASAGIVGISIITCALAAIHRNRSLSEGFEVPSRVLSGQISSMQQWITEVNTPKDMQIISYVTAAIQQTGQLCQEWQSLVNSGKARIKHWQGVDFTTGLWKSPDGKTKISIIFRSKEKKVIQSKKRIYSPDGTVKQFYSFAYYENSGTIKRCNLDNREILLFHPGNKISCYARKVEPAKEGWETWYEIEWDEEGKIIREQTRTHEIPKIEFPAR